MKPGISFFFFCFTLSLSFAQGSGPSADEYFEHGKYKEALSAYHQEGLYEEDKEKEFNLAVCQFEVGEFAESRKHFDNLVGQRHEISNCYFYLGRIAHCEQNHTEAIKNYKLFLKRASKKDSRKKQAVAMIKRCAAGLKLSYVPQIAYIENLGPNINTTQDEIAIRQSPNYSNRIYYSSNRAGSTGGMRDNEGLKDEYFGNYSSDILYTENISGTWQEPTPLGSLLNGPKHEIVQDFVNNGQGLIFSKGINPNKGAIYVDTFTNNSDKLQYPSLFESKIVGVLGDKDIQTHNDSTFIFASKRVTGYGAYDLYVTAFRNGEWQEPENLGPEINSDFDEVTPFLTQDGKKLYFSSNNYKSLGGFDVFVSEYNTQEGQWSTPQNLGSPINSSGDEKHYIISKDGMSSMFASH